MAQGQGQGQGRVKAKSEYGAQLAEKQKIRGEYVLREKQFKRYFDKGQKPGNIFALLELRLDSIAYRAGFATTRNMARQIAGHGHLTVNGRKVTIPSYALKPGDKIAVRESSRGKGLYKDWELKMKNFETPTWVSLDKNKMEAEVKSSPDIKENIQPFNFQTVIEFYSR